MNENRDKWCENVILVDADYVDKVAFDLIVNFERMLGRRIPQGDMARWLECVALDGGLRPQTSDTIHQTSIQVVSLASLPTWTARPSLDRWASLWSVAYR